MRDRVKEFIDFYKQRLFCFYRDRGRAFLNQMNHFCLSQSLEVAKYNFCLRIFTLQGILSLIFDFCFDLSNQLTSINKQLMHSVKCKQ